MTARSDIVARAAWTPLLWVGAFAALWGLIEALGYSIAGRYHFTQIVVMRYAVHLLLLLAVCGFLGGWRIVETRHLKAQLMRGLCMFVMPAAFIIASSSLSSRNLWSVFWVMPLIVMAWAYRWLGERTPPRVWLYAALGYIGVLGLLRPNVSAVSLWSLFPLLSGLSFAGYLLLSRQLRHEPIETSLFYTGLVALLLMVPFAAVFWRPIAVDDLPIIVSIGAVGLVGLFAVDRALEYLPAGIVAPLLFTAVGFEALLHAVADGELPSRAALAGGVLVIVAAAAVIRAGRGVER